MLYLGTSRYLGTIVGRYKYLLLLFVPEKKYRYLSYQCMKLVLLHLRSRFSFVNSIQFLHLSNPIFSLLIDVNTYFLKF